jgi:O-methyltransferase involved in polyketide biosynthesis
VRWVTVDLPEAIAIRARFLPESDRRIHVARSAIDHAWLDELGDAPDVFVIAQGLFMYLEEASVRALIAAIAERAPRGELFFDTIPRWASARTVAGAKRTPHYTLPAMPWGIDTDELAPFVRGCSPRARDVTLVPYRLPRGPLRWLLGAVRALPPLATKVPTMVHARFGG